MFTCDRDILFDAINTVIKTVPAKAAVPILEGILIETCEDGTVRLTGSDTEISTEVVISGEDIKQAEKTVVPAKKLFEMVGKMNSGTVYFNFDNKMLHLSCGVLQYDLPISDADNFPSVPMVERKQRIIMKKSAFADMIKKTVFSVAQNDAKPVLKGEKLDVEGNSITAVTSDQFRLSVCKKEFNNESSESFSVIVPGKTLSDLAKMMKTEEDGDIVADCATTHVLFEFDNVKVTSKLISGEFSNYKNVMPKAFKTEIVLNTAEFRKVIERASVLTNDRIKNPVKLSIDETTVVVSCRTPEGMSFLDEANAKITGEHFEIGFNDRFLLDILGAISEEEITLYMNSPVSPACIKGVGNEQDVYLVSPIKIRSNDN